MKKEIMKKGRRNEIKLKLSPITIGHWEELYAEGDYPAIAALVNPATTPVTISAYIRKASKNHDTQVPESINKAITEFYRKKAKDQEKILKAV